MAILFSSDTKGKQAMGFFPMPLLDSILIVIFVSARKQMMIINATFHIATMANKQTIRPLPIEKLKRKTVGGHGTPWGNTKMTIAMTGQSSLPQPAALSTYSPMFTNKNFLPEQFFWRTSDPKMVASAFTKLSIWFTALENRKAILAGKLIHKRHLLVDVSWYVMCGNLPRQAFGSYPSH